MDPLELEKQSLFFHHFHHADIGMALVDLNLRFLKVNQFLGNHVGYSPEELLDRNYQDLIHPDDLEKESRLAYQLLNGSIQRYQTEIRFIHKDGYHVWGAMSASLVRAQNNLPSFIVTHIQTLSLYRLVESNQVITQILSGQQKLREAEEMYELITQNSQDIITITSPEGVVRYVSPAIERLLAYKQEEILGTYQLDLYHPDDVAYLLQRVFKDEDICVCRVRHKNGSYIWFETTIKFIRNKQGEIEKVLGVARDISDRKKDEERYKRIVEESPDAIFIGVNKFLYVNQTAVTLFGAKNKEELLEVEPISLIHPDYQQPALERKKLVEQGIIAESAELKYVRLDGQVIDVEVKSIPTFFNGEQAVHTIVRDVSERKKTQLLLQQSDKLTLAGEFAAGIAHEIRNPLTSIKGFLQLIQNNADYKEHYLKIMSDELNRIETILSELLLLAKPQKKNYRMQNIVEIVSSVVSLLETQAILKDVQLQTHYESDDAYIYCDENQLKQVFINLIKNSIEAMPNGGEIKIEIVTENKDIVVRFADQGCGIPEEILSQVGQPFFTTKETGTGLGLSVSFSIIEAHQGMMVISSEADVGTTITVTLPSIEI